MMTYTSYVATGTTGNDTFYISNQMAWNSFRNKSVNGSSGTDVFQIVDPGYLSTFNVSSSNGIVIIATASAKVYLTGFEKVTYNGITKWEATTTTTPTTPGSGNDTVTGTAVADSLNGYAGNDTLTGLAGNDTLDGGTGADSMVGGLGNDTYIVDNTGDVVIELANQGSDLVKSSISFTLSGNVENLTLTDSTNINGTGNVLANVITGNSGNNALDGGAGADTLISGDGNDTLIGGTGKDVLTGGAGSDIFRFDVAFSNTDFDTITDFVSGTDKISLKASLIGKIGSTVESSEFLIKGTATQTATHYLIYDKTTGYLSYDADGSGAGAAIKIVLIGATSHPTLVYTDFVIA
ncbi:MAG: hypothetical protein RIR18_1573 [Pseudomonadota bacterium]|jgi:Ca2+-binding RTX toxin-like protein